MLTSLSVRIRYLLKTFTITFIARSHLIKLEIKLWLIEFMENSFKMWVLTLHSVPLNRFSGFWNLKILIFLCVFGSWSLQAEDHVELGIKLCSAYKYMIQYIEWIFYSQTWHLHQAPHLLLGILKLKGHEGRYKCISFVSIYSSNINILLLITEFWWLSIGNQGEWYPTTAVSHHFKKMKKFQIPYLSKIIM